jgi:nucleoside-diphosphate-sugar epimerase
MRPAMLSSLTSAAAKGCSIGRSRSELVFVPYKASTDRRIDEMFHRAPAINRIESATGWRPTLSLDQIATDVIEHTRGRAAVRA